MEETFVPDEPKQGGHRFSSATTIIIVVVLILLALVAGYAAGWNLRDSSAPMPTATVTTTTSASSSNPASSTATTTASASATTAASTYTNTQYGYSFTIPVGYVVTTTDSCGNVDVATCGETARPTSTSVVVQPSDKSVENSLTLRGLDQGTTDHNIDPYNYLGFMSDPSKATKITLAGHTAYEATTDTGNATKIIVGELVKGKYSIVIYQYGTKPELQSVLDSIKVVTK